MPLDPTLIYGSQGVQGIQLPNALDQMQKFESIKNSLLQNKALEKQTSDSATMSDILKKNTAVDPATGAPTINKQAALTDLYNWNPTKALELQKQWRSDDFDKMKQDHAIGKELTFQATPQNWPEIRQKGIQMGLTSWQSLPPVVDENTINRMQVGSLDAEAQIKKLESDRTFQQKDTELDYKHEENQINKEKNRFDQYQKHVTQVEEMAKSMKGDPSATAAANRISAAAGGKAIIDRYRDDFDKMPISDLAALAAERAKSITGGVPSEAEIAHQMPTGPRTLYADLAQKATGKLQPAYAGDWVRNADEGFKAMEQDARPVLEKHAASIASDPFLKQEDAKRISGYLLPPKVYQDTVKMRDPRGNIREVPADQVKAAIAAGGKPL